METATAIVIEMDGYRPGFRIVDGPHAGSVFASVHRLWWMIGHTVKVRFHPQDQFAVEVA